MIFGLCTNVSGTSGTRTITLQTGTKLEYLQFEMKITIFSVLSILGQKVQFSVFAILGRKLKTFMALFTDKLIH